jgi:hypothetical protein
MYNATSVPTSVRTVRSGRSRTLVLQAAGSPRFTRPGRIGIFDALGQDETGAVISREKANHP